MKNRKVLLVTGGSSDMGTELIKRVASDYDVILAHYCHSREILEMLQNEVGDKLVLLQADFSDAESVAKMIRRINDHGDMPDHIVHLASAKLTNARFHKDDWDSFDSHIETSIHSIIDILHAFVPNMIKNKYGKLVFMLSSVTLNKPTKYQAPYVMTKYALLGLMKCLSEEYADKNIMINAVSPDMVNTKYLANIPEVVIEKSAAESPLGRILTVDDVIPTVRYLLSADADAVTGQNIGITGGR